MKKLLLLQIIVLSFLSCSVDPIENEFAVKQTSEINASTNTDCEFVDAGPDNSLTITESEAEALESWDEVRKLYVSLLAEGVSKTGTFDPSIWDIINKYQEEGIGEYTTTYTITEGECSDSVSLTVNVVPDGQGTPPCDLNAGPDNSMTITESEATAIPSWDEVRKLYLSLLPAGVSHEGTFDPSVWDIINKFNSEEGGTGEYSTTYTIGEGECTDSVKLTVFVVPDEQGTPPCDLNAGPDNSMTITHSEAAAIPSWDEVRKLYISLLPVGVSHEGTFDPSIWDIINRFQTDGAGEYTTTYTLQEGDCTDSVNLTIIVIPDEQGTPPCNINAGPDNSMTITEAEAAAIESWDEVRKLYLRLLESGVSRGGTFDPSIWDIIHRFQAERKGDFTITYTISDGNCTDTVELTVTVI